jgi:hypothetical protein
MISYDKFEGLVTNWIWFDKLLCKLFGHPDRRFYESDIVPTEPLYPGKIYPPVYWFSFCARCLGDRRFEE